MGEIFAERLRELLWHAHMSQADLAIKAGLTRPAISNYIRNNRCPHSYALVQIADVLNVSTDYLLGRTNNPRVLR